MVAPSPSPMTHLRLAPGAPGAVVAIAEIARFAPLRKLIGYGQANAVVQALAARIVAAAPGAEIGRIGRTAIEFALVAPGLDAATRTLEAVAARLNGPVPVDGRTVDLAVHIGAVDASGRPIADELFDAAAGAVLDARARGVPVAFAAFGASAEGSPEEATLFRHLGQAARRGELELFYQPKLHARSSRFTSAEALLRWRHPRFGTVPADRFIPIAERGGLIGGLTDWVLARMVEDQATLVAAGHRLSLFMNLSGQLVADQAFAARALAAAAAAAAPIGFEITETAVIAEPQAALANLHRFRDAGIRIAIDDYGSGLSSLAYLKQLPAHELKIDRMFVSGLVESHRDPLLVRSTIDLAHALEMEVTAEGVNDPIALSLLRVMGCDLVQGYMVAEPMPLPALLSLLGDEERARTLGASAPLLPRQAGVTGKES